MLVQIGNMINAILIEVLGSIAENERNKIRSRQREGIEAARKRKVQLGRPALIKPVNFDSKIEEEELSPKTIMNINRFLHKAMHQAVSQKKSGKNSD